MAARAVSADPFPRFIFEPISLPVVKTYSRSFLFLAAFIAVGVWWGAPAARAQSDGVYPSVPFDEAAAAAQLEPGTGEIAGYAMAKEVDNKAYQIANLSKGHRARRGTLITVYPVTPYLEEWLKLRKKHGARARLSPEAYSYRIIISTNDRGEFYIPGLKPGRYYLEAAVWYSRRAVAGYVQTGTEVTSVGGAVIAANPVYAEVYGDFDQTKLVSAYAVIKREGGQDIVTLRN